MRDNSCTSGDFSSLVIVRRLELKAEERGRNPVSPRGPGSRGELVQAPPVLLQSPR